MLAKLPLNMTSRGLGGFVFLRGFDSRNRQKMRMPLRTQAYAIFLVACLFKICASFCPHVTPLHPVHHFLVASSRSCFTTTEEVTDARHVYSSASKQRLCTRLAMHMVPAGGAHSNGHEVVSKPKQKLNRRRVSRFFFASLATLAPGLIFRRKIGKFDLVAFFAISGTLALSDRLRLAVRNFIQNANTLRQHVIKHTPGNTPLQGQMDAQASRAADRVTLLGVFVNLLLSVMKLIVGYTCNSSALVADAGHSLSDLVSDFVTLWAVRIGRLPPDDDHPYGHGKFEAVGSLFLSLLLLGAGVGIGAGSYQRLLEILTTKGLGETAIPTFPALIVAGLSVLSKEWLYRITKAVGERIRSPVVIANAWHHRSDAYSSVLALASIAVAMTVPGLLAADSAAGLLVAGMICTTGAEILVESVKQLTDTTNEELVESVTNTLNTETVKAGGDVLTVGRVRARQVGSSALVDATVTTTGGLSGSAARAIEQRLRWKIMKENPGVIDAEVHATSNAVCPLLMATAQAQAAKDDETMRMPVSSAKVEEQARQALMANPAVGYVTGVTVHYSGLSVGVDASVKMRNEGSKTAENMTVAEAETLAKDLRRGLEEDGTIEKANIFLDLNRMDEDKHEDESKMFVLETPPALKM